MQRQFSGTLGKLDGNLVANKSAITYTISGLSIPNNGTIFLRWLDFNATGTDDGLGIDDFKIKAYASVLSPSLTVPASVSSLDYIQGNGPSAVQTLTVSGSNLNPYLGNNIIYIQSPSASSNFEIDADGDNSYTEGGEYFSFTGNSFSQTVKVRLKSGLLANITPYNEGYTVDYYNDANSPFNVSKTLTFSGTVSAPPSPSVSFGNNWTSTAMSYPLGTGPSANRNATISGTNLTGNVSVTANDMNTWEVSMDGTTYAATVIYTQTGGTIGINKKIYVRLKAGLPVATYNGTLTASSPGATDATYTLVGAVTQPVITLNPTIFSQFTYAEGQGPSDAQITKISGIDLAGNVDVSVPTGGNWELSKYDDFSSPGSTITLNKNTTNNNLSGQPVTIYVRLKAGLPTGNYDFLTNDEFKVSSLNAETKTANLDGVVTAPVPFINVRADLSPVFPTIPGNGDASNSPNSLQNTLFAMQTLGQYQTKGFTIENLGGSPLIINSVTLDGDSPLDFRIDDDNSDANGSPVSFPYTVAANSTFNFPVTFAPTSIGTKDAIVVIGNNSSNKDPYRYNIRGTGNNAEINVKGNTTDIPNGNTAISTVDNTFIGNANINSANPTTASQQFTVENLGNITLNVSAINILGANAGDFSVNPANLTVAAGAISNFTVTFAPGTTGVKNALISIANNDATGNEDPYTFAVQGNASSFVTCALGIETIIYQTNFEVGEGFEAQTTYTNDTPIDKGPNGGIWKVTRGNISLTQGIDNQSLNLRLYQSPALYPNAYTNFAINNVAKVTFKARTPDNIPVRVTYSIDGVNYINPTDYTLTGVITNVPTYTYTLSTTVNLNNVSLKFQIPNTATRPTSGNKQLIIDDIKVFSLPVTSEKTWNGTTWSGDGIAPTPSQKAIIAGAYITNSAGALEVCSCQIENAGSLVVGNANPVIVHNDIINYGTENIVVESDGNLIQKNDNATYTGNNIIVKRDSRMKRLEYIYWGTPVEGQVLRTFSPKTVASRFYSYNEIDDTFSIITTLNNPMVKGQGYVIRAPNDFTTNLQSWTGIFTGRPTNGIVNVAVTKLGAGKNLVGNPYPSNIDLDQLTEDNPDTAEGVYYFWTNINDFSNTGNTTPNGSNGNYDDNNYASYNGLGGTPAANSSIIPSGIIKPGQGFLYEAKAGGTLKFTNNVRTKEVVDQWNINSTFISNKTVGEPTPPSAERYWLKLTNPAGNFNTVLLGYIEGATNSYESRFDAKFPVASSDRFYSVSDGNDLIIQGRQYPFSSSDVVPLGMTAFEAGTYTISLSEKEGIFANGQHIYLKDKQTGIVTNLSEGSYSYLSNAGENTGRFEIVYKPETVLVTDSTLKEGVIVYRDSNDFVIKSPKILKMVEVYDLSGRAITVLQPNSKQVILDAYKMSNGIYVLKITATDGEITNKKISR